MVGRNSKNPVNHLWDSRLEDGFHQVIKAYPETCYGSKRHDHEDLAQRPLREEPQEFSQGEQHQEKAHTQQDNLHALLPMPADLVGDIIIRPIFEAVFEVAAYYVGRVVGPLSV